MVTKTDYTVNKFQNDFFFHYAEEDHLSNKFTQKSAISEKPWPDDPNLIFYQAIEPSDKLTHKTYYRIFFLDFLGTQGALVLTVLSVCSIFMSFYSDLVYKTSMATKLYLYSSKDRVPQEDAERRGPPAVSTLSDHLKSHTKFWLTSYALYVIYKLQTGFCCCLRPCFLKCKWYSTRESKYKKLHIAIERLMGEQDIMTVIKQNRLGRLLLKMNFSALDRHTTSHTSEYVVND